MSRAWRPSRAARAAAEGGRANHSPRVAPSGRVVACAPGTRLRLLGSEQQDVSVTGLILQYTVAWALVFQVTAGAALFGMVCYLPQGKNSSIKFARKHRVDSPR